MNCPDGGTCHHGCEEKCWRVRTCGPLSASGWEDWPEEIKEQHAGAESRIEDLLTGGGEPGGKVHQVTVGLVPMVPDAVSQTTYASCSCGWTGTAAGIVWHKIDLMAEILGVKVETTWVGGYGR